MRRSILTVYTSRFNSIRAKSAYANYTVREIEVPAPVGYIAGKLWEPNTLETVTEEEGRKQSPVICVHGWLDNAGSFDGVLPLMMRPNTTFFAMDLPGHGFSSYCPTSHYDGLMEGLIAIGRVSNHFGWGKFSLFGHSMGGIISFLYSGLFPEQVQKYIGLENIKPLYRNSLEMLRSSVALVFEVEERMKANRRPKPYDTLLKNFYEGRMETVTMEGCRTLLKRGAIPTDDDNHYQYSHNLRTLIPPGRTHTNEESEEIAREIKCPVCFIKGDPGNTYESTEYLEQFLDIIRKSNNGKVEYHLVPGTHHFHVNDPTIVASIASKFLNS